VPRGVCIVSVLGRAPGRLIQVNAVELRDPWADAGGLERGEVEQLWAN
jgi:hypothetical protein